jgi:drug/metabolite transporter (DMT)-like permease
MHRWLAWILLFLVLAIFLAGPVFEHFDHWDNFPQSGNDILLTVIAVLVCLAAAVSLIRKLAQLTGARSDSPPEPTTTRGTLPQQENCCYSDSPGLHAVPLRI